MKYAIKITDQKGNWEADSTGCAENLLLYDDKRAFLRRINNISDSPYFFHMHAREDTKFGSYQEVQCLCKKLNKLAGNSRTFRPINRTKCLYITHRNYSRNKLSNSGIRRWRKASKSKDPQKETPFETLRRKTREKENR